MGRMFHFSSGITFVFPHISFLGEGMELSRWEAPGTNVVPVKTHATGKPIVWLKKNIFFYGGYLLKYSG